MPERASAIATGISLLIATYRAEVFCKAEMDTRIRREELLRSISVKLELLKDLAKPGDWNSRGRPILELAQSLLDPKVDDRKFDFKFDTSLNLIQEVVMLFETVLEEQERSMKPVLTVLDIDQANRHFYQMLPGAYVPYAACPGPS